MAKLSMECKKLMVEELSEKLNKAGMLVVTNYKGLTSQDLNELRKELRQVSAKYLVVKTSIAKKALESSHSKGVCDILNGDIGIAFDDSEDPSSVSKILTKFAKDHKVLQICGGYASGETLTKDDIKAIASLPSREELLGKLANVLNAPIQGLAGALNQIIAKVVYALNAVKEKKEKEPVTEVKAEGESKPEAEVKAEAEEKKEEAKEATEEKTEESKETAIEQKPEENKEASASENKEEDTNLKSE